MITFKEFAMSLPMLMGFGLMLAAGDDLSVQKAVLWAAVLICWSNASAQIPDKPAAKTPPAQ